MNEYLMTSDAVICTGSTFWDESKGPRPQIDVDNFAKALQTVRDGIATMNVNMGDIGELVESGGTETGFVLAPHTLGQLLMVSLPLEADDRLHSTAKLYWMQVAEFMGPDYLRGLRKVAAFMDKIDQF